MNSVILVGRLTSDPVLEEFEKDKKRTVIDIAVPRNYKNTEGIYETDFIRCVLWNGIALNTSKYCKCGDSVGIKGRIQTRKYIDNENQNRYVTEVIAQSVSFLAPSRKEEKNEESE